MFRCDFVVDSVFTSPLERPFQALNGLICVPLGSAQVSQKTFIRLSVTIGQDSGGQPNARIEE